ncbi:MAG: riboflavin synthase [Desulfopila sp.]
MFTGLIEGTGKLQERKNAGGGLSLRFETDFDLNDPVEGESVAINGICLTAYAMDTRRFSVDVSPESVSRSTLGALGVGGRVNMERALKLSDRLGGHIVSGHVDCTARISGIETKGDFTLFSFVLGDKLERYVIEKGSITIDGISLTVNRCRGREFSVSIIPHTLQATTLGEWRKGSEVNIEVDIIGKYVEKMVRAGIDGTINGTSDIKPGFLAEHGFY